MTRRPVFELIRVKKPWVRLRRLLFGWNVRFMNSYLPLDEHQTNMVPKRLRSCQRKRPLAFLFLLGCDEKSLGFDPQRMVCPLVNRCYRLIRINAVCYSRPPAVSGDRYSLTMVFHNCGRNCGKKQNFHLRKPVTVFFTVFYHDNGYRPSGTV